MHFKDIFFAHYTIINTYCFGIIMQISLSLEMVDMIRI